MTDNRLVLLLKSDSFQILIGQSIWALSQAVVVFWISDKLGLEAVANYVLGLALFSPLCLLFGENARNLLAVDNSKILDIRLFTQRRLFYSVLAYFFTMLVLLLSGAGWWIAMILLSRVSDQVSDLIFGYYQREGQHRKIAISLANRGAGSLIVMLISFLEGWSGTYSIMAYVVVNLILVAVYDVRSVINNSNNKSTPFTLRIDLRLHTLYPFWDAIHLNMLRYSFTLFLSKQYLGYLGLAQTLYMPAQLLITALGYSYITRARNMVLVRPREKVKFVFRGVVYGVVAGVGYVAISGALPVDYFRYVFDDDPELGKVILMYLALIMMFLGASGFMSQLHLAYGNMRVYSLGPHVGIMALILIISLLYWQRDEILYVDIMFAFLFSVIVRFLFVFCAHFTGGGSDRDG